MMKRLLALLIALLLPTAALAQASCTEWLMTVDETLCAQIYAASGIFGEKQAERLSAALAKVMNGLGVRVITQDNGGALEMVMAGKTVADFAALEQDDQLIITSTLAPGYAMTLPAQLLTAENDALETLLAQEEWAQLVSGAADALMQTADCIEVTTTRGSFSGDAYEGGVYCTAIRLDDSDVSALLSSLLTEDVRALVTALCQALELDAESLLAEVDALNQRVAQENAYEYLIRLVSDETGRMIGVSAVVMHGTEQLATLSVGLGEQELRIVAGTGMGEENYWLDLVIVADDSDEKAILAVKGTVREFLGAKDQDFRMAAALADDFLASTVWTAKVSPYQNGVTWAFTQNTTYSGGETVERVTLTGMTIREDTVICTVKLALNNAEYMTLAFSRKPCEPVTADYSGLTLCDLSVDDQAQEALLEEIGEDLGMNLVLRLLEVLPLDVLTMLMND